MDDLDAFMLDLISKRPDTNVLAYTSAGLDWFRGVRGQLTVFSSMPMTDFASASEYHLTVRDNPQHLLGAFEDYCSKTPVRYGIIYLNERHVISALVPQINAALRCSTGRALFFFPGAVPPKRGMAGPKPTEDWWLGERWALTRILAQAGATVQTALLGATGLLLANGLVPLDLAESKAISDRLHAEITTDAALEAYFHHSTVAELSLSMDKASGVQRDERFIKMIVDPLETGVVSREIDAFQTWQRPPPMFVADLSTQNFDTSELESHARSQHGVTIDEFTDVDLIGRDLILVGPRDAQIRAVYGKNKLAAAMEIGLKVLADEIGWDAATKTMMLDGSFFYPKEALASRVNLSEPVFLGTPDEFLNFGMWLLYSVPGIRHFHALKDRYPRFMACTTMPWQRQLLLDLGVSREELLETEAGPVYHAAQAATMRQTYRSLTLPPSDMEAFDAVADQAVAAGGPTPEKIFISRLSRTQTGAYRALVNEAELIAGLETLGFVAVEPETLPILAQARLFRNAKAIVGLGGAAMFNVAFCRPGIRVVDIESTMVFINAHASLFGSRGVEYGLILGEVDPTDPSPHQRRWTIDVKRTVDLVRCFT